MSIEIVDTSDLNSRGEVVKHLIIDDVIWMSNTDDEYKDIERAVSSAKGVCYVGGLGLGLIVVELAKMPDVDKVVVCEIDPNIIYDVGISELYVNSDLSFEEKSKIRLYEGDARKDFFSYKYDWMYIDTYVDLDERGARDYMEFKANAVAFLNEGGVVECWGREEIEIIVQRLETQHAT